MRRFIGFLLILILAIFVGTLIVRAPGFIMVAVGNWSLAMPLWLSVLALIALLVLGYALWRMIQAVLGIKAFFEAWILESKRSRQHKALRKGITALLKEDNQGMIKQFSYLAECRFMPHLMWLLSARAAALKNDLAAQNEFLEKARVQAVPEDLNLVEEIRQKLINAKK
ncbi:MAG: hypothetical protein EBX40_03395 [Gammaproteobacteria bacterium]|nr:hypothetical protein [Gammaproteobacteria bacterium]